MLCVLSELTNSRFCSGTSSSVRVTEVLDFRKRDKLMNRLQSRFGNCTQGSGGGEGEGDELELVVSLLLQLVGSRSNFVGSPSNRSSKVGSDPIG